MHCSQSTKTISTIITIANISKEGEKNAINQITKYYGFT